MPITGGLKLAHDWSGTFITIHLDQEVAWEMLSTVLRPYSISSPQEKISQSCEPEAADLV